MSRIRFEPKSASGKEIDTPSRTKATEPERSSVAPAVQGETDGAGFALTPSQDAEEQPAKKTRRKKSD